MVTRRFRKIDPGVKGSEVLRLVKAGATRLYLFGLFPLIIINSQVISPLQILGELCEGLAKNAPLLVGFGL
jgi:hypothetical protein